MTQKQKTIRICLSRPDTGDLWYDYTDGDSQCRIENALLDVIEGEGENLIQITVKRLLPQ